MFKEKVDDNSLLNSKKRVDLPYFFLTFYTENGKIGVADFFPCVYIFIPLRIQESSFHNKLNVALGQVRNAALEGYFSIYIFDVVMEGETMFIIDFFTQ